MKTSMFEKSLPVALLASLVASGALAHDVFVPCWRGQTGTTVQEWRFDTSANPANPEASSNPYGGPQAEIAVTPLGGGWKASDEGFGTQTGLWDLGFDTGTGPGKITLTIPNRSGSSANSYKNVWLQITEFYDGGLFLYSTPSIAGATQIGTTQRQLVESPPPFGGWYVSQSVWQLEPNPASETIVITAAASGALVDQIVVDTICIDPAGNVSPAGTPTVGTETSCLSVDFGSAGSYTWNLANASGTAGTDWDLLSISGTLTVSATPSSRFTIKPTGTAASFNNQHLPGYTWRIATATDTITTFDASKFAVDASQFQNFLGGGSFSVALSADAKGLDLTFTPHACAFGDITRGWTGSGDTLTLSYTNVYGLKLVKGLLANNCSLTYTAYGDVLGTVVLAGPAALAVVDPPTPVSLPDGTIKVVVLGTRPNASPASCNAEVADLCNNLLSFDPVFTVLQVGASGEVREVLRDIPAAERYVTVRNHTPGLSRLRLIVNGFTFSLYSLFDGETRTVDVGEAMNPGTNNTVVLVGEGPAGASALIVIADSAAGEPLLLPGTVTLQLERTENGLRLSWPEVAGFALQSRSSLLPDAAWLDWPELPTLADGRYCVNVSAGTSAQFFRLAKP